MDWRPKGHVSLQEVAGTLLYHVEMLIILSCMYTKGEEERAEKFAENLPKEHRLEEAIQATVDCNHASNSVEAELAINLLTSVLLLRFIEEFPPVLVSINGAKFEVHDGYFWHRDQLEVCHPDWPIFENYQFKNFRHCHVEGGFDAQNLIDRFTFVDFSTETLKVKNATRHHLEGFLDPSDVEQMLQTATAMKGFRIFWEAEPTEDDFLSAMLDLVTIPAFQRAVVRIWGQETDNAELVVSKVSDEFAAEREARSILLEDKDQRLRSTSLRELVGVKIGERPWTRVVGRLRREFPHISKAGAPKKLGN